MITEIEALQANAKTLREELRIEYVLERHECYPAVQDHDGKLHYHNPFRDDDHPSLDVFSRNGRIYWGDLADPGSDGTNSAIDLLLRFYPDKSLPEIIDTARDYLVEQIRTQWSGPTVKAVEHVPLDQEVLDRTLARMLPANDERSPWWGLEQRPGLAGIDPSSYPIGYDPVADVLVWILANQDGIQTLKFRRHDGSKYGIKGGGSPLIRFAPAPFPGCPVLLLEGETDTTAGTYHLGDQLEVIGVPGVGNTPERLLGHELDGRIVYIAFDGDKAGREGSLRWASYLGSRGCDVRICVLPEGKDVCKLRAEEIRLLPERARVRAPKPQGLVALHHQYHKVVQTKDGDKSENVSNFTFEPETVLIGENNVRSYHGTVRPTGRKATLTSEDLRSRAGLSSWARRQAVVWYGTDTMVAQLEAILAHDAAFLPEGRITDQVGLFDGTFVWHNGNHIGEADKVFAGSVQEFTDADIFIRPGRVDRIRVFEALYRAQHPAVTTPMLAWLAAAPLRTRFDRFPTLGVTGVSGTGKSTLTEEFLRVFSGTGISTNLTSTTAFGVEQMLDGNRGFPVHFDEYRPGARRVAKDRLDQLLRDAYTGQPSMKGSVTNNQQTLNVTRTLAPIVVTGEESFTETSHLDRMIPVRLLKEEQGDLGALAGIPTEGFAYEYLESLRRAPTPVDDAPVHTSYKLEPVLGFNTRQGENIAVLYTGWSLLEDFLREEDPGYRMPELNLDRIQQAYVHSSESSPVLDLVRAAYEASQECVSLSPDGEEVWVSITGLSGIAKLFPSIVLPTNTIAGLRGVLVEQHDGVAKVARVVDFTGTTKQKRVVALAVEVLGLQKEEHVHENYPEV